MNKPLRSLSGLLDFDCAARWGSFKLAAQELHKTPAAISLQVKQLEEALGFDLFSRHPRHISLTEKGQEFSATVRRMLGDLNTKVAALQGGDEEKILRLSTTHSLAIKWLVPRIARFTKLHPELDIRIDSSDTIANMEDGSTDIALRTYDVVRTDPDLLFHDRLVAVYSPSLVLPGETEITLADLERYPLLHEFTTDTWIALLRQNNALKGNYNFSRSFTNFAVMVQSALAGQGIALVSHAIASDDLRSGALKMVDCESAPYERGYRVIVARDKRGMSKITHFRAWLQEEVAEMQKGLQ
ncbi:LysR family transcriptional regulator [Pseudoduganella sp. FT25W]|jgi:LysR family glycine cleavage system transcriptional activator|uniref:LysR family transcriptional regulator n=1 Tax=Duganella alba TaxID=2666081 RepID=A0A6L5QG10_9BURK|nr:LysR substrate-binding domain-containing protein [Duganella alba]MRX08448.1 LysR family transcriptional regulator [Duganella alba]MRX17078.1 LysR family transcriptional regulator [Duganella alba]